MVKIAKIGSKRVKIAKNGIIVYDFNENLIKIAIFKLKYQIFVKNAAFGLDFSEKYSPKKSLTFSQ